MSTVTCWPNLKPINKQPVNQPYPAELQAEISKICDGWFDLEHDIVEDWPIEVQAPEEWHYSEVEPEAAPAKQAAQATASKKRKVDSLQTDLAAPPPKAAPKHRVDRPAATARVLAAAPTCEAAPSALPPVYSAFALRPPAPPDLLDSAEIPDARIRNSAAVETFKHEGVDSWVAQLTHEGVLVTTRLMQNLHMVVERDVYVAAEMVWRVLCELRSGSVIKRSNYFKHSLNESRKQLGLWV